MEELCREPCWAEYMHVLIGLLAETSSAGRSFYALLCLKSSFDEYCVLRWDFFLCCYTTYKSRNWCEHQPQICLSVCLCPLHKDFCCNVMSEILAAALRLERACVVCVCVCARANTGVLYLTTTFLEHTRHQMIWYNSAIWSLLILPYALQIFYTMTW